MKKRPFVWLGLFVLSGCVANYPKDMAFESIIMVDRHEQAELALPPAADSFKSNNPYRDFLFALSEAKGEEPIKPDDMVVYLQRHEAIQLFNKKPRDPLFKIKFTSSKN